MRQLRQHRYNVLFTLDLCLIHPSSSPHRTPLSEPESMRPVKRSVDELSSGYRRVRQVDTPAGTFPEHTRCAGDPARLRKSGCLVIGLSHSGNRLVAVQVDFEHPEWIIAHDSSLVLFGLQKRGCGPPECDRWVLPVRHSAGLPSHARVGADDTAGGIRNAFGVAARSVSSLASVTATSRPAPGVLVGIASAAVITCGDWVPCPGRDGNRVLDLGTGYDPSRKALIRTWH